MPCPPPQALVTDSTELNPDPNGQLKLVPSVPILLPSPYGVAVRKGNTELAGR